MDSTRAVIVLAGGLGSRLGTNKPLRQLAGKPLINHVIDRVSSLSNEIIVVIARDASRSEYSKILPSSVRIINDEPAGKSPLVGIVTALRATKVEFAVILTCDIPFVNRNVVKLLLERAANAEAAVPRWKEGQLEPLQAVYLRESTLPEAEEALANGRLAPTDLLNSLRKIVYVSIEDEIKPLDPELRTFFNVNTRQDLEKAEMILGRQK